MDVALPQSVNGNMRYYSLAPYNHVTIEEGEDGATPPRGDPSGHRAWQLVSLQQALEPQQG